MTICIAAMAEKKFAIVASDRMVTLNLPSTEFEQNVSKTIPITDFCLVSAAGNALGYYPIHNKAVKQIEGSGKALDIERISQILKKWYTDTRNEKLEEYILAKNGLNLRTFTEQNQILAPSIVANIHQAMTRYNYGVSLLVAGVDSSGPHIFRIDDPGRLETFEFIGHCSIGSGDLHSISTFIANDYDPNLDLNHVTAMVYEAKRRSEKAQGVGAETDIYIVSENRHEKLSDAQIEELDNFYNKKIKKEKETVSELEEVVKGLHLEKADK